jgi:hypothetical protein
LSVGPRIRGGMRSVRHSGCPSWAGSRHGRCRVRGGQGPAPKAQRVRERDTVQLDEVVDTGELHGFPLPELEDGQEWHPQTLVLWDALRSSPLLADEGALGWQFLVDTARMHHVMWSRGRWDYAGEIRLRVAKYGATPEDRMRLKVKVTRPGDAPAPAAAGRAGVADIASRRERLTS